MCVVISDPNILVMQCYCKVHSQSTSFSHFFSISVSNESEKSEAKYFRTNRVASFGILVYEQR